MGLWKDKLLDSIVSDKDAPALAPGGDLTDEQLLAQADLILAQDLVKLRLELDLPVSARLYELFETLQFEQADRATGST